MMPRTIELALAALVVAALPWRGAVAAETTDPARDYPTNARADYVFGCMAANGQTRDALERCSCSLDIIASILPYERYVQAETVLMMRQGVGRQASMFRSTKVLDDIVADLRRAQAEAEIRCFR